MCISWLTQNAGMAMGIHKYVIHSFKRQGAKSVTVWYRKIDFEINRWIPNFPVSHCNWFGSLSFEWVNNVFIPSCIHIRDVTIFINFCRHSMAFFDFDILVSTTNNFVRRDSILSYLTTIAKLYKIGSQIKTKICCEHSFLKWRFALKPYTRMSKPFESSNFWKIWQDKKPNRTRCQIIEKSSNFTENILFCKFGGLHRNFLYLKIFSAL